MSLKNKVYIVSSFILVVFMILLTFLYLGSHKKEIKPIVTASSTTIASTSTTIDSTSSTKIVDKKSEEKETTPTKETVSSSEELKSTIEYKDADKDNHEYVSNYRYVYEAVGDDDFTVVSKLTGVDVDTLAKANSLSKDAVFKKGDRIFVP